MDEKPNQPDQNTPQNGEDESQPSAHKTYRLKISDEQEDAPLSMPSSSETKEDAPTPSIHDLDALPGDDEPSLLDENFGDANDPFFTSQPIIEEKKEEEPAPALDPVPSEPEEPKASHVVDTPQSHQVLTPATPTPVPVQEPIASTEEQATEEPDQVDAQNEEPIQDDSPEPETQTEPILAAPVAAEENGLEAPKERLGSLDALRGFNMLWIVGAAGLFEALTQLLGQSNLEIPQAVQVWLQIVATQLTHVSWEGFHFYDLIFPMFVFITGASLSFSITKRKEDSKKSSILFKILWRTAILYLLGVYYYASMDQIKEFGDLRYMGVLQRIAIAYGVTAILFLFLPTRALIACFAVILLGYYAALAFIPFEGSADLALQERFEEGENKNLVNNFDSKFLPGYKWGDKAYDPEGLLSNIPAVGSCLMGVFAGLFLMNVRRKKLWKFYMLFQAGIIALGLGYGFSLFFPIIKNLWTSSFVLIAGGWSLLLLSLFYLVIDIWKVKFWYTPLVWVGANAITIYLMWHFVDFNALASHIIQFQIESLLGVWAPLAKYFLSLFIALLILRFLYIKKIFLRL